MVGRGRGGVRGKGGGGPSSNNAGARGALHASFLASTNSGHLNTRQSNGQWKNLMLQWEPCCLHVRQGFTPSHFSLSEEARNTERHHSWNSDLKLRHSRVAFVSAGASTAEDLNPVIQKSKNSGEFSESSFQEKSRAPTKVYESQSTPCAEAPVEQMSNMTLKDLQSAPAFQAKSAEGLDSMSKRSSVERDLKSAEASNEVFFTDLKGADEPVLTGLAPPLVRRSLSPTGSDSSGEIVLFAGRRHSCQKRDQKHTSDARSKDLNKQETQTASKLSGYRNVMATVIDDPIKTGTNRIQTPSKQRPPSFSPSDLERAPGHLNGISRATATKSRRRRRGRHPRKETKDERILDDYVANLRDGGDLEAIESSMFSQRDLGGSNSAGWQDEVESLTAEHVGRDLLKDSKEWDSADLEDFDHLSTSNEALDSIEQVLSKRERPSGVQYLVTGTGYTVDDARWLPVSSLNNPGAEELIQDFEDQAELNRLLNGSDVSDASLAIDEQVAQDLQEDLDGQEDDKDLEDRRQARMTDEQIARLLSKQEELGLGSKDLMLFDAGNVATDGEEHIQLDGLWERPATHQAPSRSKETKRSPSNFPSATAFADILDQDPENGFDVMDQQRPSLRKIPKGRRGKLSMELSDSEFEQSIQTAWEKDRTKKKMRKQEREQLRMQGLLGKKNKIDLKVKYSEGITMTEVKNEIRDFLISSRERYVTSALLPIINAYRDPVCRFHRWLKENVRWYTKLPMPSN